MGDIVRSLPEVQGDNILLLDFLEELSLEEFLHSAKSDDYFSFCVSFM